MPHNVPTGQVLAHNIVSIVVGTVQYDAGALMRALMWKGGTACLELAVTQARAWSMRPACQPASHHHHHHADNLYWEDQLPADGPVPSKAQRWVYAVGAVAGWPATTMLFLAVLPPSRTSPLLALAGLSSHEAIWMHKARMCARGFVV